MSTLTRADMSSSSGELPAIICGTKRWWQNNQPFAILMANYLQVYIFSMNISIITHWSNFSCKTYFCTHTLSSQPLNSNLCSITIFVQTPTVASYGIKFLIYLNMVMPMFTLSAALSRLVLRFSKRHEFSSTSMWESLQHLWAKFCSIPNQEQTNIKHHIQGH